VGAAGCAAGDGAVGACESVSVEATSAVVGSGTATTVGSDAAAISDTGVVCRGMYEGREVIGIDCKPLILQYGSLHCATMKLPAGTLREVHR
jgi:agmatine deiminase